MRYDTYQTLTFARRGRILTITMNRPEKLNAVDARMHEELARVFYDVALDEEADIVVLTGAGKGFSAGGDFGWFQDMIDDRKVWERTRLEGKRIVYSLLDLEKPVIAKINGPAMGLGATMALFCDVIFAARSARIGDPHVSVGLVAGDGGAVIWPQLIGYARAKELLMTGDQSFIGVLRKQMDNIYAQKKVENGKTLLPQMYGDPRGYKYDGAPQWYHYTDNLFTDRLTEIYLWSMDRRDLERVPKTGWIGYLEGQDPEYPVKALQKSFAEIRENVEQIRTDVTTPDTRLADYLMDFNPVSTDALANLTMGAYFSNGKIWTLHARFRYFDPVKRRAGLPEDVGALVEKLAADAATVTLVNTNPVEARTVVVQAGGYGEHRFESVKVDGVAKTVGGPLLTVRLAPGAGAKLEFAMARYVNPPTLAMPWNRGF